MRSWIIAAACMAAFSTADAEIISAAPGGFSVRHVADVPNVNATAVWAALADVSKWWNPEHTYSSDARNLTLEPLVHGCFCEKLGLYGGVEHARVVNAQPGRILRLSGALGPLQEFGIAGVMTWQIDAAGGGSRITLSYNAGGYADRPLADWAPIVDEVLGGQLQRFARFLTTGTPEAAKSESKPESKPEVKR